MTLKEVEELEQLTQQLMQDMDHPQRQSAAVNGESRTPPFGDTSLVGVLAGRELSRAPVSFCPSG